MQAVIANETVRLTQALPELNLDRGQVGVVRSSWMYPNEAYEVEFNVRQETQHQRLRLLLLNHQIEWD